MKRIAILGATSQIAKDLTISFSSKASKHLHLFARRPDDVSKWLKDFGLSERYMVNDYAAFGTQEFDVILNFVGVGDPAQALAMGSSIFDITLQYDELALNYLRQHPECGYIFLSSGAVYGSSFNSPVNVETKALVSINDLQPHEWYGVAKLHAECRHRSLSDLKILDLRVFNYFSRTQNIEARFLIADIVRAIRDQTILKTTLEYVERDYIGPIDFYQLVSLIIEFPIKNAAIDCYSKAPINKSTLLAEMQAEFGLMYEQSKTFETINATGKKPCYYSLNRNAEQFGYRPEFSSLENIIIECEQLLRNKSRN